MYRLCRLKATNPKKTKFISQKIASPVAKVIGDFFFL
jgi:hypothetical protein